MVRRPQEIRRSEDEVLLLRASERSLASGAQNGQEIKKYNGTCHCKLTEYGADDLRPVKEALVLKERILLLESPEGAEVPFNVESCLSGETGLYFCFVKVGNRARVTDTFIYRTLAEVAGRNLLADMLEEAGVEV